MASQQTHPTRDQVQSVIGRFRRYAAQWAGTGEDTVVVMDAETIRRDGCGTVASHAGHYAAAYILDPRERFGERASWRPDLLDRIPTLDATLIDAAGNAFSSECGMRLLTRDLGFYAVGDLLEWADGNPAWGNLYGGLMFFCSQYDSGGDMAFAPDDETAMDWCLRRRHGAPVRLTLGHVIAKWEQVRDRLPWPDKRRTRAAA